MPLNQNMTLTVTFTQPVNASPNVTIQTVNVNVVATMGQESVSGVGNDYQNLVDMYIMRGLWISATQYIPGSRITLITLNT